MKKVFLTLVAVATMGIANAQLFVGGDLSFMSSSAKQEVTQDGVTQTDKGMPKLTNWMIAPKIGFQTDKLAFGVAFGMGGQKVYYKNEAADPVYTYTEKFTGFGAIPFVRYNLVEAGNLALFAELQIPIMSGKSKEKYESGSYTEEATGLKFFELGVSIVPGLSYNFTDNLSLDVYLDIIRLGYYMDKYTIEDVDNNYKNVTTLSRFEVGAQTYPMSFGHSDEYVEAMQSFDKEASSSAKPIKYGVQSPIKIGLNFKF